MSIDRNIKPHEFRQWLTAEAVAFRHKIELEVEAFDTNPKARDERIKKAGHKKTGYRFFCQTYFPHYLTRPNSKLHDDLFEKLPAMVHAKTGQKELVIAPRGSAKSTHTALMFPLYCVMLELKRFPIIIMDAFEQAAIALEAIKAELEINPRLAQDFPKAIGKGRTWREDAIITQNNIKIEAFGTGKKIRGRRHGPCRPDLVVLDDIENDQNIESPRQRDKLESWILKAVLELGPPDGSMDVLYAGTIIHFDGVIVRFAKKPGWKVTRYQAIMNWPDNMELWDRFEEVYLNDGEAKADQFYKKRQSEMDKGAVLNWPANHTLLFLMKKRAGNHAAFASEYQNKPIAESNPFGKIIWWTVKKPNLVHFGAIDPSLGKRNKARDPSAILIGGVDRLTGTMDVLEASIRKRLPDQIIFDAIALQKIYRCHLWFVEAVQFQEFFRTTLQREAAKAGVSLPTMPVTPHADKDLRIERLQPPIADGLIQIHPTQQTLIDQLQQWPNADHDDGPDALDMLWQGSVQFAGAATGKAISAARAISTKDTLSGYRL